MPKEPTKRRTTAHPWEFKARFRRHAFGWRSQPAIARIKEAVAEIKKAAKADPMLGAEGAIGFIERVSPALEHVDSSSGALGAAVNKALSELVPLVAGAPADDATRGAWLERLYTAFEADRIPYIEYLGDLWGDACATKEIASAWADRLLPPTRRSLHPDRSRRVHFQGTSACLSALFRAERYDEIVDLLQAGTIWSYQLWGVRALAASGKKAEAIRFAESCRGPYASGLGIDMLCEEILLSSGLEDEAYARYGLRANQRGTYLATFRAVVKKYPRKTPQEILRDLAATTPGEEGKWFAAAKDEGLYDDALALANRSPCDPRTLARAARDYAEKEPAFAAGAGLLALHWIVQGYGYEITSADVWDAYRPMLAAAERLGASEEVHDRLRKMISEGGAGAGFVARILARELGQ